MAGQELDSVIEVMRLSLTETMNPKPKPLEAVSIVVVTVGVARLAGSCTSGASGNY